MKYKCLVFDHDDTVVNSTATIHHPSFVAYLERYFPDKSCSLDHYFLKNFDPGFLAMCKEEYGLTDGDLEVEYRFWQDYVRTRIPQAYPGVREIMERHRARGGLLCVVSHSVDRNILRDYRENGLPEPDLIYGWEYPPEQRKPAVWPLEQIMKTFGMKPDELLVVDDLKPGYDMAKAAGVPFAAAGWANDIPQIENFMRSNCGLYFKTVKELKTYLFS